MKIQPGKNYVTRSSLLAKFLEVNRELKFPYVFEVLGELIYYDENGLYHENNNYDLVKESVATHTQQRDYVKTRRDEFAMAALAGGYDLENIVSAVDWLIEELEKTSESSD